MRVKSHIWVSAYLRRLDSAFITAVVVRRGDADAGAIYIKISYLDGFCCVFAPVSASIAENSAGGGLMMEDGRAWEMLYPRITEADADAYLNRQALRDADIWVLEVESASGQHLLGEVSLAFT